MIRPRVYEVFSVAPCEEIMVGYPTPLAEAELSEFKELMALVFKKLDRRAVVGYHGTLPVSEASGSAQSASAKDETLNLPPAPQQEKSK